MKTGIIAELLLVLTLLSSCNSGGGTSYYFDAETGSDGNTGRSASAPFRSFSVLDSLEIRPGDRILLKSGCVFQEPLRVSVRGTAERPVLIGKYGGEALPHLQGDASELEMVHIYNSEHIVVQDLEISNKGERIRPHLSGLKVELHNYGKAENITIERLFIHDVYGSLIKGEGMEHEDAGGGQAMLLTCYRDDGSVTELSYFDGLTVQDCHVKDCQRNGIMMWGNWARNAWLPSLHVVFRNNLLEGVPGDGIVPTACDGALVEYNVMRDCPGTLPSSEACDGIWPFSCDNTLVQYNIVSDHKSKVDGYGFDSDYNSRNSTFLYNLSYNNDGGFLLLCNSGGWPEDWSAGNVGTTVRYNVSINDGIRDFIVEDKQADYFSPVIHITGPTLNSTISDNIFYVPRRKKPEMDHRIVCADDWRGYADSTYFLNNSVYVEEPSVAYDPTLSTHNYFSGNVYCGPLSHPEEGFSEHVLPFDGNVWYRGDTAEWDKLMEFLRDKTVPLDGKDVRVWDLLGYRERETGPSRVDIFPDSVLARIPARPAGINVNYLMDGGRFPTPERNLETALADLDVRFIRFPGGEKSDYHLFSAPPFDTPGTSLSRNIGLDNYSGMFTSDGQYRYPPLDFDAFMAVCRDLGAEPVVVVPADRYQLPVGAGQWNLSREQLLEHAVAWVRYANLEKKYGIRYWMIGNESWNRNNEGSSADQYARDVVAFSRAMKAVDPSILVIPNGDSDAFIGTLLRIAGEDMDLLCVSNYGVEDFYDGYDSYRNNRKCLIHPALTALDAIRRHASPELAERLGLIVAEYGTIDWYGHWDGTNDIGHALVNFDMTGQLLGTPGVLFPCFWNTRWVTNSEAVKDHDALDPEGNLTPTGMSLKIWNRFSGQEMLATTVSGNLVAFCSRDASAGKLYLHLINKGGDPQETLIRMNGSPVPRPEVQWSFHGESPADRYPVWEACSRPGRRKAVLKPYSITVLEYDI